MADRATFEFTPRRPQRCPKPEGGAQNVSTTMPLATAVPPPAAIIAA